jgi:hypothetical protein
MTHLECHMDNFDIPANADRSFVYLSFSEKVPVDDYILRYLKAREFKVNPSVVLDVRQWLAKMPGTGPLYKGDVDYFLDTNVFRQALAVKKRRFA